MGRGGHNKGQKRHPDDCTCGNCPKVGGRKKQSRPTTGPVAGRVLVAENAYQTWRSIIQLEKRRLGINPDGTLPEVTRPKALPVKAAVEGQAIEGEVIDGPDYPGRFSVLPLMSTLRYLEDREHGRPLTPVAHQTKEPLQVTVNIRRVGS